MTSELHYALSSDKPLLYSDFFFHTKTIPSPIEKPVLSSHLYIGLHHKDRGHYNAYLTWAPRQWQDITSHTIDTQGVIPKVHRASSIISHRAKWRGWSGVRPALRPSQCGSPRHRPTLAELHTLRGRRGRGGRCDVRPWCDWRHGV